MSNLLHFNAIDLHQVGEREGHLIFSDGKLVVLVPKGSLGKYAQDPVNLNEAMKEQTIGRRLQALRKSAGLSQKEFAECVELTQTEISVLERGDSLPGLAVMRKICKRWGLDLSFWMVPE